MINTNLHIFPYKLLHNIVYLNKKYFMNLQTRYPQFSLFAWKSLKSQLTFYILVQNKVSLDVATSYFPKFINYLPELHPRSPSLDLSVIK